MVPMQWCEEVHSKVIELEICEEPVNNSEELEKCLNEIAANDKQFTMQ